MDKFKNKYRIPSTRLQNWDYGWNAPYFVTICTKNRKHFFGEIVDGEIKLSEIGKIVETEWLKSFEMRPDMNLLMGEYIIMPNHFHGIIIIGKNKYNTKRDTGRDTEHDINGRDAMHCVSTVNTTNPKNKFGPQSKNLASIIRGFKIGVTINARKINPDFAWQPRFHDHIIRNNIAYRRISNYIINNPSNWKGDKFNSL